MTMSWVIGHNYVGHTFIGYTYTDHYYIGHPYIGHDIMGHNYVGTHGFVLGSRSHTCSLTRLYTFLGTPAVFWG